MVKYNRQSGRPAQQRGGRCGNLFTQARNNNEEAVPGTDGVLHPCILCFNCNKYGHYSSNCTEVDRRRSGALALLCGTCFAVTSEMKPIIEQHRSLLDTCSMDNVCNDMKLLKDVHTCREDEALEVVANGGSMTFNTIGTMKIFPLKAY